MENNIKVERDIIGEDYLNKVFGDYRVVSLNKEYTDKRHVLTFNCECTTCGYQTIRAKTFLKNIDKFLDKELSCPICRKQREVEDFMEENKEVLFGDFKIIGYNKERSEKEKRVYYICQCNTCGNIIDKSKSELVAGKNCNCTECKKKSENIDVENNIMGHVFGDFKVIGIDEETSKKNHVKTFVCQCTNCKKTVIRTMSRLKAGEGIRCTACKGKVMGDDITGNIYEDFKVIEYSPEKTKIKKIQMFKCECTNCGNIVYRTRTELTKNINTKCQKCHNDFDILLTDVKDMIGKTFGDFTVIRGNSEASKEKNKCIVVCKCNKCGNEFNKARSDLLHGVATKCKCNGNPNKLDINDFLNKTFGDLYVLSYNDAESKRTGKSMVNCKCLRCGSIKAYDCSNLKNGNSKTCGCSRSGYDSKFTIPMIGKTFGDLTVIEVDQEAIDEHVGKDYFYKCKCSKGHISRHRGIKLRNLESFCPICKPHGNSQNYEDLTGQKFGRLTVIKEYGKNKDREILWECACTKPGESEPHETKIVSTGDLKSGYITSCGCENLEVREENRKYDSDIHKDLKSRFRRIEYRCTDPNCANYNRYAARGIKSEFENYEEFYDEYADDFKRAKEMYPNQRIEMDRIDNNGNYASGNIRFVPHETNNINRENTQFYVLNNQLWSASMLAGLARANGNNIDTAEINRRLNAGWGIYNSVFNPTDNKDARYIRKPIYDVEERKQLHKTTQGLHPDDVDYFYNDSIDDLLACDYNDLVKYNLEKRNNGGE